MKQLFIILFVLFSNSLSGQEIPYSIEVFDGVTSPVHSHQLKDIHEGIGGAYLNHKVWAGGDDYIISFFDGELHTELFTSENQLNIVGSTEQGVFLIEDAQTGSFDQQILFVTLQGTVDTLSNAPLYAGSTHQLGDVLYTFSFRSGIRSFTIDGTETVLATDFRSCNCSDEFYEFDGRLVYQTQSNIGITDGTPGGTRTLFPEDGDLLEYNGLLLNYTSSSFLAYDPLTNRLTDLFRNLPNISGTFFRIEDATIVSNGILFVGILPETGRELFLTDGTKEGTRLLMEINPGPEDGVSLGGRPDIAAVGNNLIFRRGPDEDSREIWTSDGSSAGTYRLLDLNDQQLQQSSFIRGEELSNGQYIFAIHIGHSSPYESYIYSVNPENQGAPAVATDTIPLSLRSSGQGLLNDRWLFTIGPSLSESLISIGTGFRDVDTIGTYPGFTSALRHFPDFAFYRFIDGTEGPDTVSVTRGATTGFVPILITFDNSASNPEIFTIGDSIYAYVFTPDLGESIFSIDPESLSPHLILDLYKNNAGLGIQEFEQVGDKIFYQKENFSSPTRYQLFSDEPYTISPVFPEEWALSPDNGVSIGSIGSKHYFKESSNSDRLSELDTETGILQNLDTLLPGSPFFLGRPVILNDRMYASGNEYLENPSRRVDFLLEVDPVGNSSVVLLADTTSEDLGRHNRSIVTDGEYLYFAFQQGGGIGPVSYNPTTGTVAAVGPPQASTQFIFFALDGQVSVEYYEFPNPSQVYWISPTGIIAQLPDATSFTSYAAFALAEKILMQRSFSSDQLFSIDRTTGDTIQLTTNNVDRLGGTTVISDQEAIFFQKEDGIETWTLWRTNGTREGTRKVMDLPLEIDFTPVSTAIFGYHVGFTVSNPDVLFLFDPSTEVLEKVNVELNFFTKQLIAINGNLYFAAYDPIFGTEIHKIQITDQQTISGSIFQDDNGNGIKEEGEAGIGSARISVDGGNIRSIFSNDDGVFSLPVKEGSAYTLSVDQPECFQGLTTPEQYSINYSQDSTYQLNFGYRRAAGDAQLSVFLNSGTIRCGFDVDFYLTIINDGCVPVAGEVSLTLGEEIVFLEASQDPESQTGQTLLFEYGTLAPAAAHQIRLTLRMPDENFVGLPVEITAMASGTAGGTIVTAEDFHYAEELRCAIDPNDKQVSPSRAEPSNCNYTQVDEALRYTIRFQNTGNDTAFTVRIMDKISPDLDLSTFKPLTSSHPFTASLREDRTAIFLFEDILLPDSTTNLIQSQGFVSFEIFPLPGLTDFSVVENTADIFFDFNQPIRTNTVSSSIVEFLDEDMDGFYFYEECDDTNRDINPDAVEIPNNGIDENCDNSDFPVSTVNALPGALLLYPNPSQGELRLEYSEATNLSVSVTNVTGSQIIHTKFRNSTVLDMRNSPPGVYFVAVTHMSTGRTSVRKIIRQ